MDYEWHQSDLFLWEQRDDSEESVETLIPCLYVLLLLVWPLKITSPHIPVRPSCKTQTREFRSKLVKQPRTWNKPGMDISEIKWPLPQLQFHTEKD